MTLSRRRSCLPPVRTLRIGLISAGITIGASWTGAWRGTVPGAFCQLRRWHALHCSVPCTLGHALTGIAPRTWTQRRRLAAAWLHDRRQFAGPRLPRTCPICGYTGVFISVGHPPRWDARCLNCGSRERHRLLWLWVTEGGGNRLAGKRILHFAPEKVVMRLMRGNPLYETADLISPASPTRWTSPM